MCSDDIGKYRNNSGRVSLTSDIGSYRKPVYGRARCTDDIAPFKGQSLSPSVWVAAVLVAVGISALAVLAMAIAGAIH